MANDFREVSLTTEQVECLKEISLGDESVLSILTAPSPLRNPGKVTIRLDGDSAEKLRELLTERLATVGFDRDYNLNPTGHMLEELIDRLFRP